MGAVKITAADSAFSWYIRTRDHWTCQRCGGVYTPPTKALHCSHFKGRGKEVLRFNELNADALCYGCHQYFTSQPDEHYHWQVRRKGQKVVDQLILLANTGYQKKSQRKEIAKYWRERLRELND